MIGLCAVCEEKHKLEIIERGRDGNLCFTYARCPITNVTFTVFRALKNKKPKTMKGRNIKCQEQLG